MSIPEITFSTGLFLIIVSVLGGGLQVKEITIPNLGVVPRILTFVLGAALVGICVLDPNLLNGFQYYDNNHNKNVDGPHQDDLGLRTSIEEPSYIFVNNSDIGAAFEFPNNKLSLDTTQRQQLRLLFRDGDGNVRVIITRTALPESKDVKLERAKEKEQWEGFGYTVTYVAPEKESNWKNWYVLSGINNKIIRYVRRWYLNDSVGSIEFTYPMGVKAEYEGIVTRMTNDLVFSETTPKRKPPAKAA
jgi:hypothetical protein